MNENIYDVVIIGAGPAGLTAGLYTARATLKTLIIENPYVTNQVVATDFVENYPGFPKGISGSELIMNMTNQVKKFDIDFESEQIKKIESIKDDCRQNCKEAGEIQCKKCFKIIGDTKAFYACAVIIATGAVPKKLGIPGEAKFTSRGVSYCATCDGAFFKGKDIVVVGGGDTAVEEAIFLTKFGKKVTVIHRREKLRASPLIQQRAFANEKIDFIYSSQIQEIIGDKKVSAVTILDKNTNEVKRFDCDGVFLFIGYDPNVEFLKDFIKLDEQGYVEVDTKMNTSRHGVFAAGDCVGKFMRQIVTACGDGATAAYSAQHYFEELN